MYRVYTTLQRSAVILKSTTLMHIKRVNAPYRKPYLLYAPFVGRNDWKRKSTRGARRGF